MAETVLVIGASRGLGREFVRQYGALGDCVIATVRNESAAAELRAMGSVEVRTLDVSDEAAWPALAKALEQSGIQPTIIIHNAGVNINAEAGWAETTFDDWRRTLEINLVGAVGTARCLVPLLRPGGRAVFLSSSLGSVANANGGYLAYRSSKAALNMLVKNLSCDMAGRGIACIAMDPGWVRTDMGGQAAPLSPEESITGMREVIAAATEDTHNGAYITYNGARVPW